MKKFTTAIIIFLAFTLMQLNAKTPHISIRPDSTCLFAHRDTCDLYLDIYNPAPESETTFEGKEKPTVIFVFGGGFVNGRRNSPSIFPWFRKMTANGYRIISIDYRLGLKNHKGTVGIGSVKAVDKAIHMAVEDLFSATEYIIGHSEGLGVDPDNIVICGSSAGAITVLQADYELANRTKYAEVLPDGFRYAGVISFSGAILSHNGKLRYAHSPAPTMMLHGTADKVVNYGQIRIFRLGFFGTDKITERFAKFGYAFHTLRFVNHGHDIASMEYETFPYQKDFLENNVIMKNRKVVDYKIDDPSIPQKSTSKNRKELYRN